MLSRGGQEVRGEVDEHGMDAKQFTIGERVNPIVAEGPRTDGTACCRGDSAAQLTHSFCQESSWFKFPESGKPEIMMAKLKFIAPLVMAGAAATAIAAAPVAAAESLAVAAGTSITQFAPETPGGGGCDWASGVCGSGDASGGSGCTADGTCGGGGPLGGGGCTAEGVCGSGGPSGGGGCVPGVGCFNWGQ